MKQGQVVMIYKDPITRKQREGKAKLLAQVQVLDDGLETWKVSFIKDGFVTTREVNGK